MLFCPSEQLLQHTIAVLVLPTAHHKCCLYHYSVLQATESIGKASLSSEQAYFQQNAYCYRQIIRELGSASLPVVLENW